jgi:hypothetical protein
MSGSPKLAHVQVSQASRRDAHSQVHVSGFESFEAEFTSLGRLKREIESRLSTEFSKDAFTKAQTTVRKNRGSTAADWLKVRVEMSDARAELISQKREIEDRMQAIKARVKAERAVSNPVLATGMREDGTVDQGAVMLLILEELRHLNSRIECMVQGNN